jgi:hypothetical protein
VTRLKVQIALGERASVALGLPRDECVDAFVFLVGGETTPLEAETPALRAVARWVLSDEAAMALIRSLGGGDPLREVRRWGGH